MNYIVHLIFASIILAKIHHCIELFDEKAWMDERGRDKYFEYSDLTEPAAAASAVVESNYSNNIDFEQFEEEEV
jgi:hypothetical protein